jgi:hypothetical protein
MGKGGSPQLISKNTTVLSLALAFAHDGTSILSTRINSGNGETGKNKAWL